MDLSDARCSVPPLLHLRSHLARAGGPVVARPRTIDRAKVMAGVCERIADGSLVEQAAAEEGVTAKSVRQWATEDAAFGALYARAREDQAHAFAEQCIQIADGTDAEADARLEAMVYAIDSAEEEDKDKILAALTHQAVQRDKLRLDARKWLTSKIAPRTYGEKQQVEVAGGVTVKLEYVESDE